MSSHEITRMPCKPQILDFAFPLPRIRSPRARTVARLFALPRRGKAQRGAGSVSQSFASTLLPLPGKIVFLTGASGSGKSTLLRALRGSLDPARTIDLDGFEVPDKPIVDLFPDVSIEQSLAQLNRFGLAEAWTYLRTPAELSAGQHWRLRLACALHRAVALSDPTVLCDEFTSLLDRITACIIARALRKAIVAPLRAIVATSHDDIADALRPDVIAACDFGRVNIERSERAERRRASSGMVA